LAKEDQPSTPIEEQLTDWQRLEAGKRRRLLLAAQALFDNGCSCVEASRACDVDNLILWRLLKLSSARGNAARCRELLALPMEKLAPKNSPGQSSRFECLLKLPEVVAEMLRLYSCTMGASSEEATGDRRTGSIATTLLRLGDFPAVPEHLAARLRAGSKPKCLVDEIKRSWTPEMEAKFRGPKHYASSTISGRRALMEELADGTQVPLQPGRVWVFDDMSSNLPFWFEVDRDTAATIKDRGLRQLVERHGCALGRQGLYCWDWATSAWLGFEMIGRLRDAYQSSDILRFLRKLVQLYGKPDKIIMERNVWQAHAIAGWLIQENGAIIEQPDAWQVPEMAGDDTARISDGIRALGIEIIYTYTPRGKPIEGAFNYHQRLVPTFLKPGEAVNIGRHAGEFEWSARQHRRASDGVLHPRDLGFIHVDRLADVSWEAMLWEGNHKKEGRDGKPLELLAAWLATSPLPPATDRDLAVFLPDKRHGTIRDGHLSAEVNGDHHDFLHPEIFATLGDGVSVDYAFDPAEPTLGAAVYGPKGFLCWASYLPAGPVISARDRSQDPGPQLIKRYKLAHRTAARMLDLKTLRTVKTSEARDGAGRVATLKRVEGGDLNVESRIAAPVQRVLPSRLETARRQAAGVTEDEFARQAGRLEREELRAAQAARTEPILDD
jgi:hypothetical protein